MVKVISSIAWSSFYKLGGILAAFFSNVILARLLTKEQLGVYFLTFSLVMFLAIIMRLGSKQTTLKTVTWARNHRIRISSLVTKILLLSLTSTLAVALVLVSGLGGWVAEEVFHSTDMSRNMLLIVVWAVMVSLAAPIGESLRALHFPGWGAAMDMSLCNILVILVLIGLYIAKYEIDYSGLLIIWVVVVTTINILAIGKLFKEASSFDGLAGKNSLNKKIRMALFQGAFPVFILNISTYLLVNASLWAVGNSLGHEEAAIYGAVIKLYNILALPLLVINMGLEPYMADMLFSGQKKRLMHILKMSASVGLSITLAVSLVFVVFGEQILELTYGGGFGEGYSSLVVILLGNIVNVWTGSCASLLIISSKERILAVLYVVGATSCIIVVILFIRRVGITGVAGVVGLSIALINLAVWFVVRQSIGIDTSAYLNPLRLRETMKTINA